MECVAIKMCLIGLWLPVQVCACEAVELGLAFLEFFLSLLSGVKYGTVVVCAYDVVVHVALASLAVYPHARVDVFVVVVFVEQLLVYFWLERFACGAEGACVCVDGVFAAETLRLYLCKAHDARVFWGFDAFDACVFAEKETLGVCDDGLEDVDDGVAQLFVDVVFGVDWDVVLEGIERVFAPVGYLCALRSLDDDVGHAVSDAGCSCRVASAHALGQLDVCLFGAVFVLFFGQRLADDEHGDVDVAGKHIADEGADVLLCLARVAVDQHETQGRAERVAYERRVVAAYHLDALGVEFCVFDGVFPPESGVAFLGDEQVGEVYLFELEFDRGDELLGHNGGAFLSQGKRLGQILGAEAHHDRVRVWLLVARVCSYLRR
jgi:hypothetical protein